MMRILLLIVILFGTLTRFSNLGWLGIFGIISILIFGFIHFKIQNKFVENQFNLTILDYLLIISSHILYLGALIFQVDGDDSGNVIAIENLLNIRMFESYKQAINLTWIFVFLFIGINIISFFRLLYGKNESNKN